MEQGAFYSPCDSAFEGVEGPLEDLFGVCLKLDST